jgi:Cu(I)/Ag(I) efflux system membrane fusion protein
VDVSIGETPAFEAREVILGKKAGNEYIIESGLESGESVVTNGTFKVDAAAQLNDKLSMMNPQPGSGVNLGAHDHGDMDMESTDMKESSAATNVDHSGHQMQNDLEELIPEYLKLREALANDDFGSAKEHIKMFSMDSFSGIEELRAEFKAISETLISRIEDEGYEGTLFQQYCPMYDGGSSWISDKKDIENPFYGTQMHNCGETVEQMN